MDYWTTGMDYWNTGMDYLNTGIATYLIRCSLTGGGGRRQGAQLLLVHTKHLAIAAHKCMGHT